ncbi:MAG TPA: DNA gyrase inhibitor YacG [Steroidobacteraceae bacterium]|nr:DNA gyrase inhibitor YacG [Steroidobacteraceae bacterium]
MAQRLRCPTCQRAIEWSDQFPYRPFCSDRCRLIDLGAWLSEEHAIPGNAAEGPDETPASAADPRER